MKELTEGLADALACEALDLAHRLEQDSVPSRVAEAIGAESPELRAAFDAAVALRRGEAHARAVMEAISSGTSPV